LTDSGSKIKKLYSVITQENFKNLNVEEQPEENAENCSRDLPKIIHY
jgi:hypothetical protein